jgi:hypothetical protein
MIFAGLIVAIVAACSSGVGLERLIGARLPDFGENARG